MPGRLDISLSAAFGVCRLLIAFSFVALTSAPLVLALYCAVVLLLINGGMLLMRYGSIYIEDVKSLRIGSLFYAADIVLFMTAIHRLHPAAFAFFQVSKKIRICHCNADNCLDSHS